MQTCRTRSHCHSQALTPMYGPSSRCYLKRRRESVRGDWAEACEEAPGSRVACTCHQVRQLCSTERHLLQSLLEAGFLCLEQILQIMQTRATTLCSLTRTAEQVEPPQQSQGVLN